MSYKVICIDVDGTLLGESGIIPEENILAIEQAYKKGVQVVISTGRIYSNAVQIAKRIQVKSPVIAANGVIIYFSFLLLDIAFIIVFKTR